MFVVFYTVTIVYICVIVTCFTSYCLCDTLMDSWNVCVCVCVCARARACVRARTTHTHTHTHNKEVGFFYFMFRRCPVGMSDSSTDCARALFFRQWMMSNIIIG